MSNRFSITEPLEETPPFVRWVLAHDCPLRAGSDLADTERTERLLRGLQAYDSARREDRIVGSIVLADREVVSSDSLGFERSAVFESFGSQAEVAALCGSCPANTGGGIAGCTGLIVVPESDAFVRESDAFLAQEDFSSLPQTSPRYRGLWIERHPTAAARNAIRAFLAHYRTEIAGSESLLAAIAAVERDDLSLFLAPFPAGRCRGRSWFVEGHCSRCAAAWPNARRQQCVGCGNVGGRTIERTRKRSGTRPYRKLGEFLSAEEIIHLQAEANRET